MRYRNIIGPVVQVFRIILYIFHIAFRFYYEVVEKLTFGSHISPPISWLENEYVSIYTR